MTLKKIILLFLLSVVTFCQAKSSGEIAFLKLLTPEQKQKAILTLEDERKSKWHYLPATMYQREGIGIFELDKLQKQLLYKFLKTSLSKSGYKKVNEIVYLENILAKRSGDYVFRDPEKYFITFYGNPEKDKLWSWSFEGHHISLNFTVFGEIISIAPQFLGANPASYLKGKKEFRVLAAEEDLAFTFLNSLNNDQRKKAEIQDNSFKNIVTRNQDQVHPLPNTGITISELSNEQGDLLFQLIEEYLSSIPQKLANSRLDQIKKEEIKNISFGYRGMFEKEKSHYYRIQGKTFLIEFDNTSNHTHTVWREFKGDFGRDLLKEHYKHSPHHNK